MADYVFQADPNFNRVILEDIEGNKVFVNSQLELDFYTASRPGGSFNGSYWQQIGNAGVIPDSTLQVAQEEYKQKEEIDAKAKKISDLEEALKAAKKAVTPPFISPEPRPKFSFF